MPFHDHSNAAGAKRQQLLELFLNAYRRGEIRSADSLINQVLEDGSRDPVHISYAGLLRALARDEVKKGREMCEKAVRMGSYDPVVFRNLARLHLSANVPALAVATLRDGLRLHPDDQGLHKEMRRLEPRREPILGRLAREHFANRILGRLATRFGSYAHG